jgi:hypothetical protein
MSEMKYGLISNVDAEVLESVMSLTTTYFNQEEIKTLEIGVFDGQTSR